MLNILTPPYYSKPDYRCIGPVKLISVQFKLTISHKFSWHLSADLINPDNRPAGFLVVKYHEGITYNHRITIIQELFLIDADQDIYNCRKGRLSSGTPDIEPPIIDLGCEKTSVYIYESASYETHTMEVCEFSALIEAIRKFNT